MGALFESKASYQNAGNANNNPIPQSPIPIPYLVQGGCQETLFSVRSINIAANAA